MSYEGPPIPLGRTLTWNALAYAEWCDCTHFLGSYWPGAYDAQSQIIKQFKEPDRVSKPLQGCLAAAYARLVAEISERHSPDVIVRVLASAETKADATRPLGLLTARLSTLLGVPDRSDVFFRSQPREPMRYIDRLSGPDALRTRTNYVLQDLFVRPTPVGRSVVVIDDIYNLGATVRVYSAALKQFCGADRVVAVNLAAARFAGGKDGRGSLHLDIDKLAAHASREASRAQRKPWRGEDPFEVGWVASKGNVLHLSPNCSALGSEPPRRTVRFLLGRGSSRCPNCSPVGLWSALRRLVAG